MPLTKSIMGETRVSAFTTDELSRHHPWKQDSSPSCLGPQAFMVKDCERWTVFILTLDGKRPGIECIHGNSWRQWVHSCPLPSSPNYFCSHAHPTLFYLFPDWRSGHHTHLPPQQVLGSWQMLPVSAFLLALVWRDDTDCRLIGRAHV